MRPLSLEPIGEELAIRWEDGQESYLSLDKLRRACPCAGCQGEGDIMGKLHKGPDIPLTPASFRLLGVAWVGGYGVQPTWADGHSTGIYSYDYLRRLTS